MTHKDRDTKRAVVFDLDGTLVDSAPDIMHALNTTLRQAGRSTLSQQEVIGMIGDGIPSLVEKGLEATGELPPAEQLTAYVEHCLNTYSAAPCEHSVLYPGVLSGLQRLTAANYTLAICTNKSEAIARQVLVALNIDDQFVSVVGGDSIDVRKPHARHILHAVEQMNADVASTIMVGDSFNDVLAANNANIPVLFMTYGYNNKALDSLSIQTELDDFTSLTDLLIGSSAH